MQQKGIIVSDTEMADTVKPNRYKKMTKDTVKGAD